MKLALFLVALLAADAAWACQGQSPDPWFEVDVSFSDKKLPKGVRLIRKGDMFFLANSTDKALVVLRPVEKAGLGAARKAMKLDPEFIHENKSVSSQAFRCVMETDPACWVPDGAYDQFAPGAVEAAVFPPFRQIYRDDRPKDASVPAPHSVVIYLEYAGKKQQLTGQAKYKLNSKYDAKAGEKGMKQLEDCEQAVERNK